MFILNKSIAEEFAWAANQYQGMNDLRQQHDNIQRSALNQAGVHTARNQAALIPADAYREMDAITQRVFKNDEGRGYMQDLMDIAKGMDIGKTVSTYRKASDKTGRVVRSMSGQNEVQMSKTAYEYDNDPVPIFSTSYGREWREQRAFSTEGFDAMFDDHENAMRLFMEDQAIYMLTGDSNIAVKQTPAQGILNHRNTQKLDLGASGSNVNLVTGTPEEILSYFETDFANALDNNYCPKVDVMWVSPQMRRSFKRRQSDATQYKLGTIEEQILAMGRIGRIETTFELGRANGPGDGGYNAPGQGNEFFCYRKDQQVLCPLVAQGASTIAIPRLLPMDDVNNMIWGAMGMRVKADTNSRSHVFYASEVS